MGGYIAHGIILCKSLTNKQLFGEIETMSKIKTKVYSQLHFRNKFSIDCQTFELNTEKFLFADILFQIDREWQKFGWERDIWKPIFIFNVYRKSVLFNTAWSSWSVFNS